ncbi:MAG: hypothetical protein ISP32_03935 [Thermoleophilia bacterium]|nr:hypothetical protein [Thermoleophilia bacterium]
MPWARWYWVVIAGTAAEGVVGVTGTIAALAVIGVLAIVRRVRVAGRLPRQSRVA